MLFRLPPQPQQSVASQQSARLGSARVICRICRGAVWLRPGEGIALRNRLVLLLSPSQCHGHLRLFFLLRLHLFLLLLCFLLFFLLLLLFFLLFFLLFLLLRLLFFLLRLLFFLLLFFLLLSPWVTG